MNKVATLDIDIDFHLNAVWRSYKHLELNGKERVRKTSENLLSPYWVNNFIGHSNLLESGAGVGQSIYIGENYDADSQLSYLNARYYEGSRGQFLSEDPVFWESPKAQDLTNPQSLNSYSYANDNPIVKKDPGGRGVYDYLLLMMFMPTKAYAPSSEGNLQSMGNEPPQIFFGGDMITVGEPMPIIGGGVYKGVDEAGAVKYVGMTTREPSIRFAEHANSGTARANLDYETIPGTDTISNTQKRIYEQSLLDKYGLQKNGGQLINKINSISQSSSLYPSVQNFNLSSAVNANSTPMTASSLGVGNSMGNFIGTYNFGSIGTYNFGTSKWQK